MKAFRALLVLPWLAPACGPGEDDLPPIVAQTEHLRIGLSSAFPGHLCAGDLARFEGQLMNAADTLGVTIDDPVEMYLFRVGELPCPNPSSLGCYYEADDRVFATSGSWDHELVHAAHSRLAPDSAVDEFFREGVAESLEIETLRFPDSPSVPSENFGNTVDRLTAGHFLRWVRATRGDSVFRELASAGDPFDLVEQNFGASVELVDEEWMNTSGWAYASDRPCANDLVLPDGAQDSSWRIEATITCDDTNVFSFGGVLMARCWNFEVTVPGEYRFELPDTVDGAWVSQCLLEDVANEEDLETSPDVPLDYENPASTEFGPGSHPLDLVAGTYETCIVVPGIDSPGQAELSISPHLRGSVL